jgi:hypothetical protein
MSFIVISVIFFAAGVWCGFKWGALASADALMIERDAKDLGDKAIQAAEEIKKEL